MGTTVVVYKAPPVPVASDVLEPAGKLSQEYIHFLRELADLVTAAAQSTVSIMDEGAAIPAEASVNFTGAGVTVTDDAPNKRINVAIPGLAIQDEGAALTPYEPKLNFTGNAMQAAVDAANTRTNVAVTASACEAFGRSTASVPATASTSFVAAGLNMVFTPRFGQILVPTICGMIGNTVANGVTVIQLYQGYGAAPSAGAAMTGGSQGLPMSCQLASGYVPFCLIVQPFAVAQAAQWIDLGIRSASGGGSTSITNVNVSILSFSNP